jgi:hypothetical protein
VSKRREEGEEGPEPKKKVARKKKKLCPLSLIEGGVTKWMPEKRKMV